MNPLEPIIVFLAYTVCFITTCVVAGGLACLLAIAIDKVGGGP